MTDPNLQAAGARLTDAASALQIVGETALKDFLAKDLPRLTLPPDIAAAARRASVTLADVELRRRFGPSPAEAAELDDRRAVAEATLFNILAAELKDKERIFSERLNQVIDATFSVLWGVLTRAAGVPI